MVGKGEVGQLYIQVQDTKKASHKSGPSIVQCGLAMGLAMGYGSA
jgi:hypothetical protein